MDLMPTSDQEAIGASVRSFLAKELPMEYAVEWSRLIELQMEGSVG